MSEEYYLKNPLSQVTFQIRFNRILELLTTPPVGFQKEIGLGNYTYSEVKNFNINLDTGIGSANMVHHAFVKNQKDTDIQIILCADYMQVLSRTYKNFNDFFPLIQSCTSAFMNHYPVKKISRTGFMYQNLIVKEEIAPNKKWRELLNRNLAPELFDDFPVKGLKTFNKTYNLEQDGYNFTCTNGLIDIISRSDPTNISQGYIIDIDGYLSVEHEYESVLQHIKKIRSINKQLFKRFITDELHKFLQPTTESQQ